MIGSDLFEDPSIIILCVQCSFVEDIYVMTKQLEFVCVNEVGQWSTECSRCFLSLLDWKTAFMFLVLLCLWWQRIGFKEATWICIEAFCNGFVSYSICCCIALFLSFDLQNAVVSTGIGTLKIQDKDIPTILCMRVVCWCGWISLVPLFLVWIQLWCCGVERGGLELLFTSPTSSSGGCKTHFKMASRGDFAARHMWLRFSSLHAPPDLPRRKQWHGSLPR